MTEKEKEKPKSLGDIELCPALQKKETKEEDKEEEIAEDIQEEKQEE